MSKQTAVEWLENQLLNPEFRLDADYYEFIYELCQQAKEMEKEQIIDAWDNGCEDDGIIDNAQQYYDETFKPEQR